MFEFLTVSKDDHSFVHFVLRPLNRNFFSNEKFCTVRCFIPLRTGGVRIVCIKFNHSKLLLAVCDSVIHHDVVIGCHAGDLITETAPGHLGTMQQQHQASDVCVGVGKLS